MSHPLSCLDYFALQLLNYRLCPRPRLQERYHDPKSRIPSPFFFASVRDPKRPAQTAQSDRCAVKFACLNRSCQAPSCTASSHRNVNGDQIHYSLFLILSPFPKVGPGSPIRVIDKSRQEALTPNPESYSWRDASGQGLFFANFPVPQKRVRGFGYRFVLILPYKLIAKRSSHLEQVRIYSLI